MCQTCEAYCGNEYGAGDCRKLSPIVQVTTDGCSRAKWPTVKYNDWCLELVYVRINDAGKADSKNLGDCDNCPHGRILLEGMGI